jgi:hypothetical protein
VAARAAFANPTPPRHAPAAGSPAAVLPTTSPTVPPRSAPMTVPRGRVTTPLADGSRGPLARRLRAFGWTELAFVLAVVAAVALVVSGAL